MVPTNLKDAPIAEQSTYAEHLVPGVSAPPSVLVLDGRAAGADLKKKLCRDLTEAEISYATASFQEGLRRKLDTKGGSSNETSGET